MIARVLDVHVDPDRVEAIVGRYQDLVRPIHAGAPGLRKHYVLTDRNRGKLTFVGIWESEEGLAEVAARLEPARQQLWAEFGGQPALETYLVEDEL
ncbi:MAG: antibiotic biosynthesis monooxygenase [Candidatus Limnocylindria bacterium]